MPVLVALLVRLNRQYEAEEHELEADAPVAAEANPLRRHAVMVFIEHLDLASARAIQYARTLAPDELRAIHFDLDPIRTEDLIRAWEKLGFDRLALDIVECPDRRITRAAAELVAETLAEPETEVTVLLPQRKYRRFWHRFLHDRTADAIAEALGNMTHVNVTIVPYLLGADGPKTGVAEITPPAAPTRTARDQDREEGGSGRRRHRGARGLHPDCRACSSAGPRGSPGGSDRCACSRSRASRASRSRSPTRAAASSSCSSAAGASPASSPAPASSSNPSSASTADGSRCSTPMYELLAAPAHELPPSSH